MLIYSMKSILISEFKAKCIAIINEVNQTNTPIIITKRGEPIARLEPFKSSRPERVLGTQQKMQIAGDIVHAEFSKDWEMNE
jgi:prevent-host-death family protein